MVSVSSRNRFEIPTRDLHIQRRRVGGGKSGRPGRRIIGRAQKKKIINRALRYNGMKAHPSRGGWRTFWAEKPPGIAPNNREEGAVDQLHQETTVESNTAEDLRAKGSRGGC